MKRILYALVILCATALSVPAMANAATNAKHPKASSTMVMHSNKTIASKSNSKSAMHQEKTRHASATHRNKKESKKG
jgi:hypothetical protein